MAIRVRIRVKGSREEAARVLAIGLGLVFRVLGIRVSRLG